MYKNNKNPKSLIIGRIKEDSEDSTFTQIEQIDFINY